MATASSSVMSVGGNVVDEPGQPISFAAPHHGLWVSPRSQLTPLPNEVDLAVFQAKHGGDLSTAARSDDGGTVGQGPCQTWVKGGTWQGDAPSP